MAERNHNQLIKREMVVICGSVSACLVGEGKKILENKKDYIIVKQV